MLLKQMKYYDGWWCFAAHLLALQLWVDEVQPIHEEHLCSCHSVNFSWINQTHAVEMFVIRPGGRQWTLFTRLLLCLWQNILSRDASLFLYVHICEHVYVYFTCHCRCTSCVLNVKNTNQHKHNHLSQRNGCQESNETSKHRGPKKQTVRRGCHDSGLSMQGKNKMSRKKPVHVKNVQRRRCQTKMPRERGARRKRCKKKKYNEHRLKRKEKARQKVS